MTSTEPLWRAVAAYRFASLAYATLLVIIGAGHYSRLGWAWGVLALMTAWTIAMVLGCARPERRTAPLLVCDLVVTASFLLSTAALQFPSAMSQGVMPVTGIWVASPVLACAIRYGRRAGVLTAAVMIVCDFVLRSGAIAVVLNGAVLLLLAGFLVGHLARLAAQLEQERRHVLQVEAAGQERERLARGIHDSVLQVLALVARRGAEAGGEAAEIGRLAGQQEAALRTLVGDAPAADGDAVVDLRALLLPSQTERVTVSVPAQVVLLKKAAAQELSSAVGAALDNVRRHCGDQAKAWVLVEEERDLVTVTIRDDGPGIADGRLAEAAAAGRLGVSQSIRGRLDDLGGTATITTAPGEGTEVALTLSRR